MEMSHKELQKDTIESPDSEDVWSELVGGNSVLLIMG